MIPSLLLTASLLGNMPPDNPGGRNAHFQYSALIGIAGSELFPSHPWGAFGACLGIGVLKELKDYRKGQPGYRHGLFSREDLKADAFGCGVGVLGDKGFRAIIGPREVKFFWEF